MPERSRDARSPDFRPSRPSEIWRLMELADMAGKQKEEIHDAIQAMWDFNDATACKKALLAAGGLRLVSDEIVRLVKEAEARGVKDKSSGV